MLKCDKKFIFCFQRWKVTMILIDFDTIGRPNVGFHVESVRPKLRLNDNELEVKALALKHMMAFNMYK